MNLSTRQPFIIAISGIKNSGKTSLIVQLIQSLKNKGKQVATIKHDGHDFDVKGTDSYQHQAAGANATIIFSSQKYMIIEQKKVEIQELLSKVTGYDFILLEGFKDSDFLKLEVVRKEVSTQPYCNDETILAYVSDCEFQTDKPIYSFEDVEQIVAALIEMREEINGGSV